MNKRKIWLFIVPVLLFALLAIFIKAGITVGFEGWAYSESVEHMSPGLTTVIKGITHLGDSTFVVALCLMFILLPGPRKTIALPVSTAVIISSLLNIMLKNIFARERPDILRLINETSYSFPSGHAMINASLYTMLVLLIFKFINNRRIKLVLSAICLLLTLAIGYSRIYLGVHYAGDVLGGFMFGFAISVFVYSVWNKRVEMK